MFDASAAAQPVSLRPAAVLVGNAAANRFGSTSSKHWSGRFIRGRSRNGDNDRV